MSLGLAINYLDLYIYLIYLVPDLKRGQGQSWFIVCNCKKYQSAILILCVGTVSSDLDTIWNSG